MSKPEGSRAFASDSGSEGSLSVRAQDGIAGSPDSELPRRARPALRPSPPRAPVGAVAGVNPAVRVAGCGREPGGAGSGRRAWQPRAQKAAGTAPGPTGPRGTSRHGEGNSLARTRSGGRGGRGTSTGAAPTGPCLDSVAAGRVASACLRAGSSRVPGPGVARAARLSEP